MDNYTCTLTFSECAENHVGMQILGNQAEKGFSLEDLKNIKDKFEKEDVKCELVILNSYLEEETEEAAVLVIRKGINEIFKTNDADDLLFNEQFKLPKDTKALMRKRVVNKKARYNLCFAKEGQEADFENGKGTVVSFYDVPMLRKLRKKLPKWFGDKAKKLFCEGNYYYDSKKCGIGFHGDSERKKVIAIRLGESMPLHYQWYCRFKPVGKRCILNLNHGDMYIMSEKAVGTDWKKSSIYTLRHAAGCEKYTK